VAGYKAVSESKKRKTGPKPERIRLKKVMAGFDGKSAQERAPRHRLAEAGQEVEKKEALILY